MVGSDAWLKKIPSEAPPHVSSWPDKSNSAKGTRRGARHSSSRRWLEFSKSENLSELLKHPSKETIGPSTISASDFAHQESLFQFAQTKRRLFVFATSKHEARNRTRMTISLRNANYLSFKFKETLRYVFFVHFFFS